MQMMDKIVPFVKAAGKYALEKQGGIDLFATKSKSDRINDVVTAADLHISDGFAKLVAKEFSNLPHIVVDEEKISRLGASPLEKIKSAEYAFILDPVDGTLPYATGLPFFAVSVGVFKNGRPFQGAIYAPAFGELVYTDGGEAFFEKDGGAPVKLTPPSETNESAPFVMTLQDAVVMDKKSKAEPLDVYSAAVRGLFIATGRARGGIQGAYLWDLAGAWCIFAKLGIEVRELDSGDEITLDNFDTPNLKRKKYMLLAHPRYGKELRECFAIR